MDKKPGKYLIVDTETTGLNPAINGLMQLAAASLDERLNILETFEEDVSPPEGVEIDPESLEVTGFTRERIKQGISYQELCEKFLSFMERNFSGKPIAAGHFYPFDYAYLDYVFSVCGYGKKFIKDILGNEFIDTKALAIILNLHAQRRQLTEPFPVTSLSRPGGLKDTLSITGYQAHTALGDVLATREVLLKLLEMF